MSTLLLLVGLLAAFGIWAHSRADRRVRVRERPGRSDTRPASWYQVATYADGRVAHLTPMRDGQHFEDETGDCGCHPRAADYRTRDGRRGVFYVHRPHRDDGFRPRR